MQLLFDKNVNFCPRLLKTEMTPLIIKGWPNTYTFTKALAEKMLLQLGDKLPIVIVRPSIVTASWREPILGWVDNLNGPTGLLAGAGKGVLRTLLCHKDLIADLVPVDICINLLISAAWYTAINSFRKQLFVVGIHLILLDNYKCNYI
ncbi:putative fatty acyl-CoA reductase isoform X2 [Aphis craccivora]|uniref:Fatty acyl-CoA reductase n=1 Tax=Aphis craccivora TaxID=307492 RepID=A0A6G0Z324_APHCR|nr:putative fatty acyl-CoA reductase isoform X2 [Aphis craccivora]